mmetsp:Transcript_18050/g.46824  ORF Transcript_18050/g.46824 Transcript_18050/m.46824 type:complete len:325 (-) Transcript_18050:1374-2348(-)
MELHGRYREGLVLDGHDHRPTPAVQVAGLSHGTDGRRHQAVRQRLCVERVVSRHAKGGRQSLEDRPEMRALGFNLDFRRLAVHRVFQLRQLPAEVLHEALQAEAHAEDRDLAIHEVLDVVRHVEVRRAARARTQHGEVDMLHRAEGPLGVRVPDGCDSRTGLPQIVCQCVHEGVLEVNEQHLYALAALVLLRRASCAVQSGTLGCGRVAGHRVQARRGFELCLRLLERGHAVEEQGGTGTHLRDAVGDAHRPQGQTCVQVPIEGHMAHRGTIPAALRHLHFLHKLHGPRLRGTADGDGPHVAQKGIQRVELRPEVALDVVDGVD